MDEKLKQIQKLLDAAEGNLHSARNLFREIVGSNGSEPLNITEKAKELNIHEEGKVIEGVYNGEAMVGPDGKDYPVPANYASKSKLVEGDILKLTIAEDGSFIFKQIKPIERTKTIGTLVYANGGYSVNAEGKTYRVLQASVTYYKGEPGDQVTIIIPKEHEAKWAAIENIIKKSDVEGTGSTEAPDTQPDQPVENNSTDEQPAEEAEPTIEFPSTPKTEELPVPEPTEASDQQIAENLNPTPQPAPEATNTDNPDEGIKELEI